jgi:hypothetical protein
MNRMERPPEKSYEEKLAVIRTKLADELEHLYKDKKSNFPATEEEIASIEKIRKGEKINATRAVIDKMARLALENGILGTDNLHRIYNDLAIGWKKWENADLSEAEEENQ